MRTIDHNIVDIALDRVDAGGFENFSQAFFATTLGLNFIPLGGMHDGGAEGYIADPVYAAENETFLQASKQEDHKAKIRQTAKRLREFGRTPKKIIYASSNVIKFIDKDEHDLSMELGLTVAIRDKKYFVTHINNSEQTVQAFDSYLRPATLFLEKIGGNSLLNENPQLPPRSLCVFLQQEIENRAGNSQLLESVVDSLILWSLEETDPQTGRFMSRQQILEKIEATLPSAKQFVRGVLDTRIEALTKKQQTNGRQINIYKKEQKYCLPYDTREIIRKENIHDESLKINVSDGFKERAASLVADVKHDSPLDLISSLCHRALEITFEHQGLELSYFIEGKDATNEMQTSISDNIDTSIREIFGTTEQPDLIKSIVLSILKSAFYDSSEVERIYLSKLSRTYCLLFILKNEPKIVEYFRSMSSQFVLYVGTDLIIRALSEHFLASEDQMTANLFKILSGANSKLIMTEQTLDEVLSHIEAVDYEFINNYQKIDASITKDITRHIERILIRSYYYARDNNTLGTNRPRNWPMYIGQFCTYSALHKPECKESLKRTLCERFGLLFEDTETVLDSLDAESVSALASKIKAARRYRERAKEDILSTNDAIQILRVYAKRQELSESQKPSPYGYKTWWLTQEVTVRQVTKDVEGRKGLYLMRPEFLLNFIALTPLKDDVRASYQTIFPSLLGVRLSNRMDESAFKEIIRKISEAQTLDEARAKALASEYADKLKGDTYRKFDVSMQPSH